MKTKFQKLKRSQVQEKSDLFAKAKDDQRPSEGWIKTMRRALDMPSSVLAKRIQCTPANIAAMERREKAGKISIELLEKVAQALDCKLVYAFISNTSIDQTRKNQAQKVAQKQMRHILHSMKLEQQALTANQKNQQEKDLIDELLRGKTKHLWDK